jgi:hypothetical protein
MVGSVSGERGSRVIVLSKGMSCCALHFRRVLELENPFLLPLVIPITYLNRCIIVDESRLIDSPSEA